MNQQFGKTFFPSYKKEVSNTEFPIQLYARELTNRRTHNSKLFSLGQNQYQAVLYPYPIHFQDHEGGWHEVDNSLVSQTDCAGETFFTNCSNEALKAEFRSAASSDMIRLQNSCRRILSWRLENALPVSPEALDITPEPRQSADPRAAALVRLESGVLYKDVFPGTDLRCRLAGLSFKDDFIFSNKESVRQISFLLSTL